MTISSVFEPCSLNFSSGYSGTKEILPPECWNYYVSGSRVHMTARYPKRAEASDSSETGSNKQFVNHLTNIMWVLGLKQGPLKDTRCSLLLGYLSSSSHY